MGFCCPKCTSMKTHVCDTRAGNKTGLRKRRRFCEVCGHRFTTVEITVEEFERLTVIPPVAKLRDEIRHVLERY